jgi:hypothetical protein
MKRNTPRSMSLRKSGALIPAATNASYPRLRKSSFSMALPLSICQRLLILTPAMLFKTRAEIIGRLIGLIVLSLVASFANAVDHYKVTYSGGKTTAYYIWGPEEENYVLRSDGTWGGKASLNYEILSAGPVKAEFTWVGDNEQPGSATTPAPTAVVVKENVWVNSIGEPASVSATTGISPETVTVTSGMTVKSVTAEAIRYTVKSGASFFVTCSPLAYAYEENEDTSVGVSYKATATPVMVDSLFAVKPYGTLRFLVGQQADFFVSSGSYSQAAVHQWSIPGPYIGGVTMGASVQNTQLTGDRGAYYYNASRTTQPGSQVSLAQEHPSVYFEGNERCDQNVTCVVNLYDGPTYVATITATGKVSVYRPVCDIAFTATGPSTIHDQAPGSNVDSEGASARDLSLTGSGVWVDGYVRIPTIFALTQGSGSWSYVQKLSRDISVNGTVQPSDPLGLDNAYPYPYSYTPGHIGAAEATWVLATGTGELNFYDAPGIGISGFSSYQDHFHGELYAVLRPPSWYSQGYVDVPVIGAPWNYDSSSSRSSTTLNWATESTYRSFPGGWIVTPNGAGVVPGTKHSPVSSSEMDWTSVVVNS